ncbi:MAG TPA: UPF0158 family protein, partial [Thermoanaerobaculia bacterium]|nr:UPF0158 family protein [Thermoanaerobaculia bacterium]
MELDWEGLTVAFAARSMLMNHFLDRATGEVHAHLNGSPELREALFFERTGRYLRIPKSTRDVDAARCRAFTPRMESAEARTKALLALESVGPGAFRDVLLSFPNDEKAWFVFRDRRVREELRVWLTAQGIQVDDTRPPA